MGGFRFEFCGCALFFLDGAKIPLLAALNKSLGDGFQFFPASADVGGLGDGDLIVSDGAGNDSEEVGEFLDDFVGGGDEKLGMIVVRLGVLDKETIGAMANPLDDARIGAAFNQGLDAVEGIGGAAAVRRLGRLGPFVNHGKRQAQLGGDLLGAAFLQNFA